MNVVFDYVDAPKRADALAVTQVVAGICGFATTLLAIGFLSAMFCRRSGA